MVAIAVDALESFLRRKNNGRRVLNVNIKKIPVYRFSWQIVHELRRVSVIFESSS